MRLPTISDYTGALENPQGVFRTLGEVAVERDIYREIALRAGNSAAVFTYLAGGARRFLKCYIRPNPYLRRIYSYIERCRPPLLADVRLLADELYVYSLSGEERAVDVVEGEWTEGETLDAALARAARGGDREALRRLAGEFDALCGELLAQEWAHGDLKPDNIVVGADGAMTLIDCDAMWLPEFAGLPAAESGTPAYRHPARTAAHFDKRTDDYPALLISASLHALALEPELLARYNTSDNIIFSPAGLVAGGSAAFGEVAELFSRHGRARELRMLEACGGEFPEIDSAGRFFDGESCGCGGGALAVAQRAGKWGFADGDGRFCIAPLWDEALEFRGDRAAVRLGRWWHAVDRQGRVSGEGLCPDDLQGWIISPFQGL